MQIHVSNLHSSLIEVDVQRLFSPFGEVDNVKLVRDKLNNRSSGRAFVEMPVAKEAKQAIISLHDTAVNGKRVFVKEVSYDPAPNASWNVSKDV